MSLLFQATDLSKMYGANKTALDNLNLTMKVGESIGVIGESGSGKSTLAKLILSLEKLDSGRIMIDGLDISTLNKAQFKTYRKSVQMVFQDPVTSLNPRWFVWKSIMEPLMNYNGKAPSFITGGDQLDQKQIAIELLRKVGLNEEHALKYPHELSGGQKQRVGIARAISLEPKLLVCDEPTASLDMSVQMKILRLLKTFQSDLNMSLIFISHDFRVAASLSHRIIVMKEGKIVDHFATEQMYDDNRHLYSKALIRAST